MQDPKNTTKDSWDTTALFSQEIIDQCFISIFLDA